MYKTLVKLASQRNTIPILNTIHVCNGTAIATDCDIEIEVPCTYDDGLYLPHGFDKGIPVESDLDKDDRPVIADFRTPVGSTMIPASMFDDLRWVMKAQSVDETRYYLNGLYFEKKYIVATDGHRMHNIEHETSMTKVAGGILPRTGAKIIMDLAKEIKATRLDFEFFSVLKKKDIAKHDVPLRFKCRMYDPDGRLFMVRGRMIDGTFPEWKRVVPKTKGAKKTCFNLQDFVDVSDEAATIKKIRTVKTVPIQLKASEFTFDTTYTDIGDAKKRFTFPMLAHFDIEIGFNYTYLSQTLSGVAYYTCPASPMLIVDRRGACKKNAVIMPMRV